MAKLVDDYCEGCLFLSYVEICGRMRWCDYIGHHGHSRGCQPGKGCTQRYTKTAEEAEAWRRKIITLGGPT